MKLIVNVENTGSVRDMRRQLAQILSKLKGDQLVKFTFRMNLEDYRRA